MSGNRLHERLSTGSGNRMVGLEKTWSGTATPTVARASRHLNALKIYHVSAQAVIKTDEVAQRFARLCESWKAHTGALSALDDIVLHPAYQRIIGMGEAALPLILRSLEAEPYHWFWALSAITDHDPDIDEEDANVESLSAYWLRWGRERGYVD
ncbi:MAG: hypothetical protein KIT58_03970 [Planctomycetota bacterium]|nr:hypothetical protein [Planctomycetota bacterium]